MFKRIGTTAVALLTLITAPASAQMGWMHGQASDSTPSAGMAYGMMMGGMMGQGMVGSGFMQMMGQGMGMMATGGPGPLTLLRMRSELGLSDDQASRLEKIQQDFQNTVGPQMSAAMASQVAASQALQGDSPDFQAYQQGVQAAANIMVQMHVAMARASVDARNVLTPEQRERIRTNGTQWMNGMMGGYGWGGAMHGGGMGPPSRW